MYMLQYNYTEDLLLCQYFVSQAHAGSDSTDHLKEMLHGAVGPPHTSHPSTKFLPSSTASSAEKPFGI